MCHDAGAQLTARKLLCRDRATGTVALRKWDAYEDSGPVKEPPPEKKKEPKKEAGGDANPKRRENQ